MGSSQVCSPFPKGKGLFHPDSTAATHGNRFQARNAFYPKWLSDKDLNDQSSIASISYVAIPYTTISDSAVKVTDEDINAYVRKHKNEFKQEESRSISYVIFDAAPNAADSNFALTEVNKQYAAFAVYQKCIFYLVDTHGLTSVPMG